MVEKAADRVTQFLLDELDEELRTVVIVMPESFDIHYLRRDLKGDYTGEGFAKVVDSFRLEDPLWNPEIDDLPVGRRHAVLHYHENAFVLQFPFSETETILISVTPEVGRDLLGFIDRCRRLVQVGD